MQNYKLGDYKGSKKFHLALDSMVLCHAAQSDSGKYLTSVIKIATLDEIKETATALCSNCVEIATAKAGA